MHRGYSRHDDEDRLAGDVRYLVRWRGESLRQREPSIASKVESTRRRLFVDRLHTQSRRGNRIDRCYDCFVLRFVFLSSFSLLPFFRFRIRNENIRRPTLHFVLFLVAIFDRCSTGISMNNETRCVVNRAWRWWTMLRSCVKMVRRG